MVQGDQKLFSSPFLHTAITSETASVELIAPASSDVFGNMFVRIIHTNPLSKNTPGSPADFSSCKHYNSGPMENEFAALPPPLFLWFNRYTFSQTTTSVCWQNFEHLYTYTALWWALIMSGCHSQSVMQHDIAQSQTLLWHKFKSSVGWRHVILAQELF